MHCTMCKIKDLTVEGLLRVFSIVFLTLLLSKVLPLLLVYILVLGGIYLTEFLVVKFSAKKLDVHNVVYDIIGIILTIILV